MQLCWWLSRSDDDEEHDGKLPYAAQIFHGDSHDSFSMASVTAGPSAATSKRKARAADGIFSWRKLLAFMGPGFLVSIAYVVSDRGWRSIPAWFRERRGVVRSVWLRDPALRVCSRRPLARARTAVVLLAIAAPPSSASFRRASTHWLLSRRRAYHRRGCVPCVQDPGNFAVDMAAGATYGYRLLWVLFVATILGLFLQTLCTRLGLVTSMNL